jgi:hypothetical protein
MTTSSSFIGLALYNNTTDQSGSFLTWTQNVSGSSNSNMTKIDSFAGSTSASIVTLRSNITGSMSNISGSINYISGSLNNISGSINALNLRLFKLYEFVGAGLPDFNNIPQTYTHLLIMGVVAVNYASYWTDVGCDFNGDANNSNYTGIEWNRSITPDFEYISPYLTAQVLIGSAPGSSASGFGSPIMAIIPNYSVNGGFYKTGMSVSAYSAGGNIASAGLQGGVWKSNNPITRIRLFGSIQSSVRYSFLTGTKISIYGL